MSLPLPSVAHKLLLLPLEIAHQVLDNVRLWDILRLACHDIEYINTCLMSHLIARQLIGDDTQSYKQTQEAAGLYWEMCRMMRLYPAPPARWPLATIYMLHLDVTKVHDWLHKETKALLWMPDWKRNILTRHATDVPGLTQSDALPLQRRWTAVKSSQHNLNDSKASQLRRVASLLEDNPDILKRTLDPEQIQRPNTAHVVSRFRYTANKIEKSWVHRHQGGSLEGFRHPFLPVIPFDAALQFVVRMLPKHGFVRDGAIPKDMASGHPPDVVSAVETILQGMDYLYLPSPWFFSRVSEIHRTVDTPASGVPKEECIHNPRFGIERFMDIYTPGEAYVKGFEPHDQREMVWLEAFVAVYRYLEQLDKSSK
ncbi:hypothetical protein AWENTII_009023 [Aspergillus wentii]|nr:hypothetical protein MW887_000778 [Aspergillus wentii]